MSIETEVQKLIPVHLHIYERSIKNKSIYRCIDPHCSHYQRREYLFGKAAKCAKCLEEFILDKKQLLNKTPVCLNCSKSKKAQEHQELKSTLEDLLNQVETKESEI